MTSHAVQLGRQVTSKAQPGSTLCVSFPFDHCKTFSRIASGKERSASTSYLPTGLFLSLSFSLTYSLSLLTLSSLSSALPPYTLVKKKKKGSDNYSFKAGIYFGLESPNIHLKNQTYAEYEELYSKMSNSTCLKLFDTFAYKMASK